MKMLISLFFCLPIFVNAQIQQIQDLFSGPNSGVLTNPVLYNTDLYFSANNGFSGYELWKYDGMSISLVSNINPGSNSSFPSVLTVFNGALYFFADDGVHGQELWKYDGLTSVLVQDASQSMYSGVESNNMAVFNNKLYYGFSDSIHGVELWEFDGTNIILVQDYSPLASFSELTDLIVYDNTLYFGYRNSINQGSFLFKFDGLNISQVSNSEIWPIINNNPPQNKRGFTVFDNKLFFSSYDVNTGYELWSYNGSQISIEYDINPGLEGSHPSKLFEFNSALYFIANNDVNDEELWKFDGSNAYLVNDMSQFDNVNNNWYNIDLNSFAGKLYYSYSDSINGFELWQFDGLNSQLIQDLNGGVNGSNIKGIIPFGGELVFLANNGLDGLELFRFIDCEYQNSSNIEAITCDNFISPSGNYIYDSSGIYMDTVINYCGGDSIITIDLEINYINSNVTLNNYTLFADDISLDYQWLECGGAFQEIIGESNYSFSPLQDGYYALIVSDTVTNCSDTSDCILVEGLKVKDKLLEFIVYPNPSIDGKINLSYNDNLNFIKIIDVLGKEISFSVTFNNGIYQLELINYSKGIYFMSFGNNEVVHSSIIIFE